MFTGGLIIGTLLWTVLIGITSSTVTWLIVAVLLGFGECTAIFLRKIPPHQELEEIAS
jgi:hypothetical protein